MEYRKLPHGDDRISVLGPGTGGVQAASDKEIEGVIRAAVERGINFLDLCGGAKSVYAPIGRALSGCRDKVFVQTHFGAVYNDKGDYGWSRSLDEIKRTVEWELETLGTDYADFGFLHCVDEDADFDGLSENGVFDLIQVLRPRENGRQARGGALR